MMLRKNQLYRKLFAVSLLAILLLVLNVIGNDSRRVEQYYSQGLYQLFCRVLQPFFNLIPFSVGDLLYLLLILLLLGAVIAVLRSLLRRRFWQAAVLVVNFVIAVQLLFLAFYLLWGMNYFRPPAAERLSLTDTTYTKTELLTVTRLLIDSANAARLQLSAADLAQQDHRILEESLRAVRQLGSGRPAFRTYKPKVKLSLISVPISYLGTAGYYNPFTAEAQINAKMPVWLKPLTACHEMAHQMGYSREDEANFVGFLAARSSSSPLVKYSAYYMAVGEFMFDVMLRDSTAYMDLRKQLSPAVLADFKADQAFWLRYRGAAGKLSSIFYDNYLKFNNQPEGLKTYNRMIKLTMAWFKRNDSIEKVALKEGYF